MHKAIQKLPESVVRQIAAGEVVIRPISVLKELVENAIDAAATQISVEIENGGKTRLSVTDSGHGIASNNLELAITPHATSKFGNNLLDIHHYGFRGEALAAIGAVSRMQIRSAYKGVGHSIKSSFRDVSPVAPDKITQGTKVCVDNLFLHVPARLKFLRADKSEYALLHEYLKQVAIIYPHLHLSWAHNNKTTYNYLPSNFTQRIEEVLQLDPTKGILIDHQFHGYYVTGWISTQTVGSTNSYLFANKRPIRDKGLARCVCKAFADTTRINKMPYYIINIEVPPQEIDVNVHPSKEEVRFLRWMLVQTELNEYFAKVAPSVLQEATKLSAAEIDFESIPTHTKLYEPSLPTTNTGLHSAPEFKSNQRHNEAKLNTIADTLPIQDLLPIAKPQNVQTPKSQITQGTTVHHFSIVGQLFNSYVVAESDDQIVVIDQHAVHERHNYELLKKRVVQNTGQLLLTPIPLQLTQTQRSSIEQHSSFLKLYGLEIQDSNLRSIPTFWPLHMVRECIDSFLTSLTSTDTTLTEKMILNRLIADTACKQSIKANTTLTTEEMQQLLSMATTNVPVCNHGRRAIVYINKTEIEKWFNR